MHNPVEDELLAVAGDLLFGFKNGKPVKPDPTCKHRYEDVGHVYAPLKEGSKERSVLTVERCGKCGGHKSRSAEKKKVLSPII